LDRTRKKTASGLIVNREEKGKQGKKKGGTSATLEAGLALVGGKGGGGKGPKELHRTWSS